MCRYPLYAAVTSLCGLMASASAQWTVTSLHPAGAVYSSAGDVDGTRVVGGVTINGVGRATMWTGPGNIPADLHPPGATGSSLSGFMGAYQVGTVQVGLPVTSHPGRWSGSPSTFVDMLGEGQTLAAIAGGGDGQAVGYARGGPNIAVVWTNGDADSAVGMNPGGYLQSYAMSCAAGQQVGWAISSSGSNKAALWRGSAASFLSLDLVGGTDSSVAWGTDGITQVGYFRYNGHTINQAVKWTGTAASAVILHPANATASVAYDVVGAQIVGSATIAGVQHARIWYSTAAAFEDLHHSLPPEYVSSSATRIWSDGVNTRIVGAALNGATGQTELILWTRLNCPNVVHQPASAQSCSVAATGFSTNVSGAGPFTYQWQWQPAGEGTAWVHLALGENAEVGGVPILSATNVMNAMFEARPLPGYINFAPRSFRCIVTNACGSVTSDAAMLTVCDADYNCDASVDFFDYLDFVDAFSSNLPGADFNGDGTIDFFDYLDFVDAFSTGC